MAQRRSARALVGDVHDQPDLGRNIPERARQRLRHREYQHRHQRRGDRRRIRRREGHRRRTRIRQRRLEGLHAAADRHHQLVRKSCRWRKASNSRFNRFRHHDGVASLAALASLARRASSARKQRQAHARGCTNARRPTRKRRAWAARKRIPARFISSFQTSRPWAARSSSPEIFTRQWPRCTPSCLRRKTTEQPGREPHPRIRSSGLDQIQFVDFQNGWISGANLTGAPRDPFLLITTDGGKTWRERPIFEETRVAAIEGFSVR